MHIMYSLTGVPFILIAVSSGVLGINLIVQGVVTGIIYLLLHLFWIEFELNRKLLFSLAMIYIMLWALIIHEATFKTAGKLVWLFQGLFVAAVATISFLVGLYFVNIMKK